MFTLICHYRKGQIVNLEKLEQQLPLVEHLLCLTNQKPETCHMTNIAYTFVLSLREVLVLELQNWSWL